MKFSVHCFEIPITKSPKGYRKIDLKQFWKNTDLKELKDAKGAYIFAMRRSKGYIPFYIGKTNNSFGYETVQAHKLMHYGNCLNNEYGSPIMMFVALRTETGKFSKRSNDRLFQWLETYLINLALKRNNKLLNIAKTKFVAETQIPCLLNSERGMDNNDSKILKQTLFGK